MGFSTLVKVKFGEKESKIGLLCLLLHSKFHLLWYRSGVRGSKTVNVTRFQMKFRNRGFVAAYPC